MNDNAKQRQLTFPRTKEDIRLATIERIWGDHPKVKTAAKMFNEENQRLAEQAAKATLGPPPPFGSSWATPHGGYAVDDRRTFT